jgi:hypothetical protein
MRIVPVLRNLGVPAVAVHLGRFGERPVRAEPDHPEPPSRCLAFQPGQQPPPHSKTPPVGGYPHVPDLPGSGFKGTQRPAADRAAILVGNQECPCVALHILRLDQVRFVEPLREPLPQLGNVRGQAAAGVGRHRVGQPHAHRCQAEQPLRGPERGQQLTPLPLRQSAQQALGNAIRPAILLS